MSQEHDQDKDKEITIIVNGRPKTVKAKEISFEQVVALAFGNPPYGENVIFTVTYKKSNGNKPEGILVAGQSVKIKDGTIFNVVRTDKS